KGAFHYEDVIRVPFIVRYPGVVPAGVQSDALQSLVDLAPSFLSAAGIDIPRPMTGEDQVPTWSGAKASVREHVIVENHHEPTTVHVKTYVDERYKLTVYYNRDYGELFDLREDAGEVNNLWNSPAHAELKADLAMKLLFAEMGKEPLWMPRTSGA
ncbi:sulfatase, partial [Candidatus Poribacteria bacterium]